MIRILRYAANPLIMKTDGVLSYAWNAQKYSRWRGNE